MQNEQGQANEEEEEDAGGAWRAATLPSLAKRALKLWMVSSRGF